MIKSELVSKIAERTPDLGNGDVGNIVTAILDTIADALARGDRVELRGFGAFSVKRRDAHTGRNPRTGETVSVSEKVIPVFKTGKEMRIRLNQAAPKAPPQIAGREIMRQFLKALVTMQQEVSGWLALKGLRPPWCVQLIS